MKQSVSINIQRYWFICLVLFAACASRPTVPVVERRVVTVPEQTESIGGNLVRVVQPGDTLYSISFAAGVSVNDLTVWNGINNDYQIGVGQKLRLTRPKGFVSQYPATNTAPAIVNKGVSTQNTSSQSVSSGANHSVQQSKTPVKTPVKPIINAAAPIWGWPTKGKIIRNFYPSIGRKGIDILGAKSQSIVAASDGTVVYVGNGLRGYGNLVIIKHSQNFLSAYANNKDILVSQGDFVSRGSRIAEMGSNESGQYALHFQIRKNGKPVNPKPFLLNN